MVDNYSALVVQNFIELTDFLKLFMVYLMVGHLVTSEESDSILLVDGKVLPVFQSPSCQENSLLICLYCRRGLIMGIWNSHTSFGNILGSVIASAFVATSWGLSFVIPGIIIAAFGIISFFTLVESKSLELVESVSFCVQSACIVLFMK